MNENDVANNEEMEETPKLRIISKTIKEQKRLKIIKEQEYYNTENSRSK